MVQSISNVSMFFEAREVKSASKVKENSFDSFLETGKSESSGNTKANDAVVPLEKSTETDGNNAEERIRDSVQNNEKEVSVSDNCDSDIAVSETEGVVSEGSDVTEEMSAGKSSEAVLLMNESVDIVSVEFTADTLFADEKEEVLPEEVLAEILTVLNQIASVAQEVFQCSDEELMNFAQEMQFEVTDFFHPDRMRELFLQVQNAEASELLTNENLCESFMELQEQIDTILQESKLTELLPEQDMPQDIFDVSEYKEQIIDFIFEHETTPGFLTEEGNAVEKVVGQVIEIQEAIRPSESLQNEVEGMEYHSPVQSGEVDLPETATSNDEALFDAEQGESNTNETSSEPDTRLEHANAFISKLVAAAKTVASEVVTENAQAIELYDIAMQVIEQVKLQVRPDTTKMEIQLNPEQLGKVEVEITSKNGELSAKLNVQNEQVKEAVEGQMQMLRETLELQGLKVENIEVTVAEFGFRFQDEAGNNQPQQQRQRRNGLMNIEENETEEVFIQDAAEVMKELNGNSIDYVA